jgi:hypothetical protein
VDFLRLMPQKIPIIGAAANLRFDGVCRVKNRLQGDFLGVLREAQQTAGASSYAGRIGLTTNLLCFKPGSCGFPKISAFGKKRALDRFFKRFS